MSPVATTMSCEEPGNILWIWLSALSCGSRLEKKNVSSTFGFRSTIRKNVQRITAVTPTHSSTGTGGSFTDSPLEYESGSEHGVVPDGGARRLESSQLPGPDVM